MGFEKSLRQLLSLDSVARCHALDGLAASGRLTKGVYDACSDAETAADVSVAEVDSGSERTMSGHAEWPPTRAAPVNQGLCLQEFRRDASGKSSLDSLSDLGNDGDVGT